MRHLGLRQCKRGIDRLDDRGSRGGPFPALRDRPQPRERVRVLRLLLGDFVDRIVLQNPRARDVSAARFPLAPCRHELDDRELGWLAEPRLQPQPGIIGMDVVGIGRFQDRHFLRQPAGAALPFQLSLQRRIDVAQMRHVGQRIFQLLVGKRPPAPVGEA